jgi:hypothetical protein
MDERVVEVQANNALHLPLSTSAFDESSRSNFPISNDLNVRYTP